MRDYSKTVLTSKLVNLTKHRISIYDEFTGKIKSFEADDKKLPTKPKLDCGRCDEYYICSKSMAARLQASGRDLDDVVVVTSKSLGRHKELIARLVWGKDMQTQVCFGARTPAFVVAHSRLY